MCNYKKGHHIIIETMIMMIGKKARLFGGKGKMIKVQDRTGVHLQCLTVYTANTLQHMQPVLQNQCSLHAARTARTLHVRCMCTPVRSGVVLQESHEYFFGVKVS